MRLTRLTIENFRCIKHLDIDLGETTVFIGPNNAGKTAILDAIRIALTRRWGPKGTGFTEYDIHLESETHDPKASAGVRIEIRTEEQNAGDWPDEVVQDLTDLVQLDPISGKNHITLAASCAWNSGEKSFVPTWTFLNAARAPLVGGSARRTNLERFWQYIPTFYLGALRNAEDEFSSRSQFWGRLLKAMEIPQALEAKVIKVLDLLNRKLLRADPRLAQVADTLTGVTKIAAQDRDGGVDLRLVPLKAWDILSKAEIILRNEATKPWLPLGRHGQGVQSLAVMFLFRAFVEHLLKETYEEHSEPVLALEEPETHLHPQAARTLWAHVKELPGQKIISTHSPYFVQHVPFRDIRLVRLSDTGTKICWLPARFEAKIPYHAAVDGVVDGSGGLLTYERASDTLTVNGKLDEATFRGLLTCYGTHPDRAVISSVLRDLRERSKLYISDAQLAQLQTFARRIRGEIFFARRWLLVEGQAEYLIVHALARSMNYDLDENGVALIDAQNNGNPAIFAVLARALSIPWRAVFDGDAAGHQYCTSIRDHEFDQAFVTERCVTLPTGNLEDQLIADGLGSELKSILTAIGHTDANGLDDVSLKRRLEENKVAYTAELSNRIITDATLPPRMPSAFRDAIASLRGLT